MDLILIIHSQIHTSKSIGWKVKCQSKPMSHEEGRISPGRLANKIIQSCPGSEYQIQVNFRYAFAEPSKGGRGKESM